MGSGAASQADPTSSAAAGKIHERYDVLLIADLPGMECHRPAAEKRKSSYYSTGLQMAPDIRDRMAEWCASAAAFTRPSVLPAHGSRTKVRKSVCPMLRRARADALHQAHQSITETTSPRKSRPHSEFARLSLKARTPRWFAAAEKQFSPPMRRCLTLAAHADPTTSS